MTVNATDLFTTAQDEGLTTSLSVKRTNFGKLNTLLAKHPAVSVQGTEIVLLCFLLDDSASMRHSNYDDDQKRDVPNYEAVMDLHNFVLKELRTMKLADKIMVYTDTLWSHHPINAFTPLEHAVDLTSHNFQANGASTPLYDSGHEFFATILAKATEFYMTAKNVRTIAIMVSDGDENSSNTFSEKDCYNLISELTDPNRETSTPILAKAVGLQIGNVDFNQVFAGMGFRIIETVKATDRESLKKWIQTSSASVISTSQSGASFQNSLNAGGF